MKTLSKKRNIVIAILMSLALMASALVGTLLSLQTNKVEAETYNYGTFNSAGYYKLDDVVFYAIKVKTIEGSKTTSLDINVSVSNQFELSGVTYTLDNTTAPTSLSYVGGGNTCNWLFIFYN